MAQIQKEEFQKSFDNLLKEKNSLAQQVQSLELENQKLRFEVGELENQMQAYKNERYQRIETSKETRIQTEHTQGFNEPTITISDVNSPKRQAKDQGYESWKQKEADMQRALQEYEDQNAVLSRKNRQNENRIYEIENKLINSEKNWRNLIDTKEVELVEAKSQHRQEFNEQIVVLRK